MIEKDNELYSPSHLIIAPEKQILLDRMDSLRKLPESFIRLHFQLLDSLKDVANGFTSSFLNEIKQISQKKLKPEDMKKYLFFNEGLPGSGKTYSTSLLLDYFTEIQTNVKERYNINIKVTHLHWDYVERRLIKKRILPKTNRPSTAEELIMVNNEIIKMILEQLKKKKPTIILIDEPNGTGLPRGSRRERHAREYPIDILPNILNTRMEFNHVNRKKLCIAACGYIAGPNMEIFNRYRDLIKSVRNLNQANEINRIFKKKIFKNNSDWEEAKSGGNKKVIDRAASAGKIYLLANDLKNKLSKFILTIITTNNFTKFSTKNFASSLMKELKWLAQNEENDSYEFNLLIDQIYQISKKKGLITFDFNMLKRVCERIANALVLEKNIFGEEWEEKPDFATIIYNNPSLPNLSKEEFLIIKRLEKELSK